MAAFDKRVAVPFAARAAAAAGELVAQLPIPIRVALLDNAPRPAVVTHPAPAGSQGNDQPLTVQLFIHDFGNGLVVEVNRHISILRVWPCTWGTYRQQGQLRSGRRACPTKNAVMADTAVLPLNGSLLVEANHRAG